MNARVRLMAGGSAIVAAIGAAVVASAGAVAAPAAPSVHVVEVVTHATYVPVGQLTGSKAQSSQGDYITFDDPLVNPGTTTHVGRVRGACWLTTPKTGLFWCAVEFTLNGKGEVDSNGLFDSSGKTTTTASISGGSGIYKNATGAVAAKALSQTKNDFVISPS